VKRGFFIPERGRFFLGFGEGAPLWESPYIWGILGELGGGEIVKTPLGEIGVSNYRKRPRDLI